MRPKENTNEEKGANKDMDVYVGVVKDIKNSHGFIKPTTALPEDYNQRKDVFFHFCKVIEAKIDKDMVVRFRLNPENKSKPEATVVCQVDTDMSSVDKRQGRNSKRERGGRCRSSSRKKSFR